MSNGSRVTFRSASTTSAPNVMFGTNRPSITSRCSMSAPPASAARTSSASRPKSAVRIDGASFTVFTLPILPAFAQRLYSPA